jgi:ergothioneine biosynthesis protein EgtB
MAPHPSRSGELPCSSPRHRDRLSQAIGAQTHSAGELTTSNAAELYRSVRRATEGLAEPLSPEDQLVQSMPDASPVKWHLAHTSWFFETFVLGGLPGQKPPRPDYAHVFNSYYEGVGPRIARDRRGMLSRPSLAEVHEYRREIDERVVELLDRDQLPIERRGLLHLGLAHEEQHQELILTDVKHALHANPLRPVYRDGAAAGGPAPALAWSRFDEQIACIGAGEGGFCFDNEEPRHRVLVPAFEIASRLVTAGEYLAFMEDGGYRKPELWLSDGWATVRQQGWSAPLYWDEREGTWQVYTLRGIRAIDPGEPVCHLSYYEADAFAHWAGARLPTEFEWEVASGHRGADGALLESGALHPRAAGEAGIGPMQMFGDGWEWTRSAYAAYPGFRPAPGAVGEYNGKFMSGQMVLRGGSCVTPARHIRASYRNFFPPGARWQFSCVRLARDVG